MALLGPRTHIDALPYVDQQYTEDARREVERLIAQELKTFKPSKDYLAPWPQHEVDFEAHPLLQAEWMRVCDKQPMPKLDTTRYQLDPPPPNRQHDMSAWHKSIENAQAQLEHQANRLVNLELLQKHGNNVWKAQLNALDAANNSVARMIAETDASIEAVNKRRKLDQTKAGSTLVQLEGKWVSMVKKNIEIESHCMRLEQECEALRKSFP
ncbi:hypothetical protein AB1Y20_005183 [Prymnesium parvum]|uniref:Pre-mRNA-splicing factor SPF27 n=1 Tax=Prymnesium parvum TaxID=97485 RepID=A0AB34J4P8_PRYPA